MKQSMKSKGFERRLLLIMWGLFLSLSAFAQQISIKGHVVDATGEPVIGASVVEKGTTNGTITDVDGNFSLSVPTNSTLTISFVGYKMQTVPVNGKNSLKVTLQEDTEVLDEVVVVGYGTMKKSDLTGAVSSVGVKDIKDSPVANIGQAMQGKVSGVQIIDAGKPGDNVTIKIRGLGTINNSNPLIVIDGIPTDLGLSALNMADVERVDVLKDASATAIYGSRGANGVVMITSKRGAEGAGKVTVNANWAIQNATKVPDMLNAAQYAALSNDMLSNNDDNTNPYWADPSLLGTGTNWLDEMLRTGVKQSYSVSYSGGTEKATYSAGMSYLAQDGIMDVENYYRRLNFRAALDYEARKWLKVGFNGVFSNSQQQLPKNAAWQQAYNTPSIIPVYDDRRDDAVFPKKYTSPEQVGLTNNFNNPVATANYYDNRNETYQVLTNFYAQLNLIPDKLNIRSSYSYDYSMIRGSEFTPTYYVGTNQKKEVTELTKKNTNYYKYIWDNVATYTDKWGKHSFTGMLGASMRQEQYRLLEGTATNVPEGEDVWKYIALGNKEGATVKDDGWKYRGLSYFTRLNYNYNDKYMLMFTFRADGSSKYNDKWGYFPSIGAAWVISQEPFMKNQNIFDYMKLRASWGKLGNDKIAASAGFASIQNVQSVFGPNTAIDGFINTTNFSWLGWEVVNETNVGVNFSTLKNRLNADIDWYYRLTDNAVISPKLPMSGELLAGNNGQILNTGIDLSLNWNDKIGQDFNYNIGVNLSYLHNEVKSLKGNMKIIKGGKTVNMVGETMNSFYGYKVIGIYQTPEQCAADPIAVANGLEPLSLIHI